MSCQASNIRADWGNPITGTKQSLTFGISNLFGPWRAAR